MTARWMRRLFNLYPPYLGAGVHVDELSDDFRFARVTMPLRWYNRNYVGTHFGGSLYSMTDPFLMIMFMRNLGPGYVVWDKAGSIEYVAPGRGRMSVEFRVTPEVLDEVRANTEAGEKYLRWFEVDVRDPGGAVVARVRKQLHFRRKPRAAG
jgi:acyl-coenzyme A thioesterase PaaI-like protein